MESTEVYQIIKGGDSLAAKNAINQFLTANGHKELGASADTPADMLWWFMSAPEDAAIAKLNSLVS